MNIYSICDELQKNVRLKKSIIAAWAMCLFAHGMTYFNLYYVGDRTTTFWSHEMWHYLAAKWGLDYVNGLTYFAYCPWLVGILVCSFLTASVYFIVIALDIQRGISIFLIAGIFATNVSFISAHFYGTFEILITLPIICLSVYAWSKANWGIAVRMFIEIMCIVLSLSIYGAYLPVGPSLVIMSILVQIVEKNIDIKCAWLKGIEYIISLICGFVFYYLISLFFLWIHKAHFLNYNGIDTLSKGISIRSFFYFCFCAYSRSIGYITGFYDGLKGNTPSFYPMPKALGTLLFLFFMILLFLKIKEIKNVGKICLIVFLITIYPLSLGLIYVISFNNVHALMIFTFCLFHVGIVKLVESMIDNEKVDVVLNRNFWMRKYLATLTLAILVFVVYRGVVVSNFTYTRLDNLFSASASIADRIIQRIEACDNIENADTVIFVGEIADNPYLSYSYLQDKDRITLLNGLPFVDANNGNSLTSTINLINFYKETLNIPMKMRMFDEEVDGEYKNIIKEAPTYPSSKSVFQYDNIIFVKLSD